MNVRERLDAYLQRNGLAALWFARPNSFAWLTGGDNVVDRDDTIGVAAAGYDGEDVIVVTDSIEGPRMTAEEVDEDVDLVTFPWYETELAAVVRRISPEPAAADFAVQGFENVEASALRQPLTDEQIDRYRTLGRDVARILEGVMRDAAATESEMAVAGRIRGALEAEGIVAQVALVGGSERAQRFRHFTPTDTDLGEYALASVTASRGGQCVSCTRTVAFDPPSWLAERTRKAMVVETSALAATQRVAAEGGTAGDVFAAIRTAYAEVGWDGEWKRHHQGGAAGYAAREWVATPDGEALVRTPMTYAWNPTIEGAKSEDTSLVTDDSIEILSTSGEWPTRRVESVDGSISMERHEILDA